MVDKKAPTASSPLVKTHKSENNNSDIFINRQKVETFSVSVSVNYFE